MKIDQELRFIVINMEADSLYSLIANGKYRPTVLGRETWRSLIGPKASSQIYCNREGFNLYPLTAYWEFRAPKARIGFVTNNADNCNDVNTRIGFGTGGPHDDSNTCGIVADGSGLDNGKQFIKAMGYILVQWRAKTVIIVRNNVNVTKKNLKKGMHNAIHAYANYPYRVWYTVIHHYLLCAAILKSCIHKKWGYMFTKNNIWAHVDMEFLSSCRGISSWMRDLVAAMYYFNLLNKRRRPLLTRKVADFFNKGWWKKKVTICRVVWGASDLLKKIASDELKVFPTGQSQFEPFYWLNAKNKA